MDYYTKYLKYKYKYSFLREKLYGGSNNNTIIICATHNNRLKKIFKDLDKSLDKSAPIKSFNNCAVIRFYRDNNNVKAEMIYEGDPHDKSICSKEKGCWDKEGFNTFYKDKQFSITIAPNTEVLLVRHGLGVHNQMSVFQQAINLKKDSQLTEIGIAQAEAAGLFLTNYVNNRTLVFMASNLLRTQQTISVIMNTIGKTQTVYIVPCAHELNYVGSDNHILQYMPVAINMPKCKSANNSCDKLTYFSGVDRYKGFQVDINWDYYTKFSNNNMKCHKTNLLDQIAGLYVLVAIQN
jgi:bisphosphoglycerate-dependent phosphoglycerate mutase